MKIKAKGAYFNPWGSSEYRYDRFKKNPECTVAIEAAIAHLTKGTPIEETIRNERDVRKFIFLRTVRGGAVKAGQYIGKVARWYYAVGEEGCMVYATSGNKVPQSDGARPLMDLPDELPADVDFTRYERDAYSILSEIGALTSANTPTA